MYNLFSFIVQLLLFLAQFVQCCTQGARQTSLRSCSCAQPGLLVLYASTRAQAQQNHADYIIAELRAPSPSAGAPALPAGAPARLPSAPALAETVVGCWDRIASSCLSIFELLLPVQLAAVQRWCRAPALAAAPTSWLQHQPEPNRAAGSRKELCPIRGGWCS